MHKKVFEIVAVKIVYFDIEDVICTSGTNFPMVPMNE